MENNELIIRNVKKEDLEQVAEIIVTGWKTAYKGIIDDNYLNSLTIEKRYNKLLGNYLEDEFIVAELNGEIVGFSRYTLYNKSNEIKNVDGEIFSIYVRPRLKRKGIGTAIFTYVMNQYKNNGNKSIILGCFKENYQSRAFYEKMGGKVIYEKQVERGEKEYPEVFYNYIII